MSGWLPVLVVKVTAHVRPCLAGAEAECTSTVPTDVRPSSASLTSSALASTGRLPVENVLNFRRKKPFTGAVLLLIWTTCTSDTPLFVSHSTLYLFVSPWPPIEAVARGVQRTSSSEWLAGSTSTFKGDSGVA